MAVAESSSNILFLPRLSLLLAVIAVAVMLIPHAEPPPPKVNTLVEADKKFKKPKVTSHPELEVADDDRMEPIDSYLTQFGIGPNLPELNVWYDNLKLWAGMELTTDHPSLALDPSFMV